MDRTARQAPLGDRLRRRIRRLLMPAHHVDYVLARAGKD
jgi:hypothetical protein